MTTDYSKADGLLNDSGKDGWKLLSVVHIGDNVVQYVFERPKQ